MGKLMYVAIQSLDGYIADENGKFDWGEPDDEEHTFINDLVRSTGTYLYGRRLYEVMLWWNDPDLTDQPSYIRDFADIWQSADKIVFSKTLGSASSPRTRVEREFDPDAVRELKVTSRQDLAVGGAELAAEAFRAALVDECHLFLAPVVLGSGARSLPTDVRLMLELTDERRFDNGTVYLAYRVARP